MRPLKKSAQKVRCGACATSGLSLPFSSSLLRTSLLFMKSFFSRTTTHAHRAVRPTPAHSHSLPAVWRLLHAPFRCLRACRYGLLVCTDSFLHMFTFMPLRVAVRTFFLLQRMTDFFASSTHFYYYCFLFVGCDVHADGGTPWVCRACCECDVGYGERNHVARADCGAMDRARDPWRPQQHGRSSRGKG